MCCCFPTVRLKESGHDAVELLCVGWIHRHLTPKPRVTSLSRNASRALAAAGGLSSSSNQLNMSGSCWDSYELSLISAMTRGHGAAGFSAPVWAECESLSGPPALASPVLSALPSLMGTARDSDPCQGRLGRLGRVAACGRPCA